LQTPTVIWVHGGIFLLAIEGAWSYAGQTEIHAAEPRVTETSAFEVDLAIEKLKFTNHQVLIKSLQNGLKQGLEKFIMSSINILFLFGIRRNCLRTGRCRSLYLFTRRAVKQIVVIIG